MGKQEINENYISTGLLERISKRFVTYMVVMIYVYIYKVCARACVRAP